MKFKIDPIAVKNKADVIKAAELLSSINIHKTFSVFIPIRFSARYRFGGILSHEAKWQRRELNHGIPRHWETAITEKFLYD